MSDGKQSLCLYVSARARKNDFAFQKFVYDRNSIKFRDFAADKGEAPQRLMKEVKKGKERRRQFY